MGMYDEIVVVDRGRITCAAGHDLAGIRLQTKDLGKPALETYFVYDGVLYVEGDCAPTKIERGSAGVIVHHDRSAEPVRITQGPVGAGMMCTKCVPVLCHFSSSSMAEMFEAMGGSRPPKELEAKLLANYEEHISEHFPAVDYELFFEDGKLTKAERVAAETREDLRERLNRSGGRAIDDTDPVAQQHFERRAQGTRYPTNIIWRR